MLTLVFGAATMSRTQVQLWYNRFKEGREDVNDNARPGTSTTDENIEVVKKMNSHNHRITIREVTDDIDISVGSCQAIPKLLNFEQKQRRIYSAQEMLTTFNKDPGLLKKAITSIITSQN